MSGSTDTTVRLWHPATGKLLRTCRGHDDMVYGVAFCPDGRRVVSCSEDRTVRLWNAKSGKSLWVYRGHVDAVSSVAVSPDGSKILSCGGYGDRSVRLWDCTVCDKEKARRKAAKRRKHDDGNVDEVVAGLFGTVVGVGGTSAAGSSSGAPDNPAKSTARPSVTVSAGVGGGTGNGGGDGDGDGSGDGGAKEADIGDGFLFTFGHQGPAHKPPEAQCHGDWVNDVCFSEDGRLAASCASDKTAKVWDVASGECLATISENFKRPVIGVYFSPNARCVTVCAVFVVCCVVVASCFATGCVTRYLACTTVDMTLRVYRVGRSIRQNEPVAGRLVCAVCQRLGYHVSCSLARGCGCRSWS